MHRPSILLVAVATIASSSRAQIRPAPPSTSFLNDTLTESPIYPVGDAVGVYRAVLDLVYHDGEKRPSVIVMLDTVEAGHAGGPCPFDKCTGSTWAHKSKIERSTELAYARGSRKKPALVQFGYPIPIVMISQDDVRRMDADGREFMAAHPLPPDLPQRGFWGVHVELQRKFPGAWGVTILSKVGFNTRHTEALLQAHQWCGDDCRVHETLFLKKTKGRWRVVERIPEQVDPGYSPYSRYLGPAGRIPKESEIIPVDRPGVPSEATARTAVYRTVLDSLYFVNGDRPKRVVLTNWFGSIGKLPAHTTRIDTALVKRFAFLGGIRAPFDAISKYRAPISTLPVDSVPALRARGVALDVEQTGSPFWVAFAKRYPSAWGLLGVSRIAFNQNRSQALVETNHACGNQCATRDIWLLTRAGRTWRIAERIPVEKQNNVEIEPLRYVGVDVNPNAYHPRRVQGTVTDYTTSKPIPLLEIQIRRTLNTGVTISEPSIRTDAAGHYTLTNLPLSAGLAMIIRCPDRQHGAWAQPIGVMPGLDTTINMAVDFSVCDTTAAVAAKPSSPNPLSGAEAFISKDSARFVFPRQATDVYEWDVPVKGTYPGGAEYMWQVQWDIAENLSGEVPYMLWLIKGWKAGGPHKGSLAQLIAGVRLGPMIGCSSCDPSAVFEQPGTDHSKVFATVENGQLIFIVRGAQAVQRVFPTIPKTVTFSQTVRQTPLPQYGPGDVSSSQEVVVNCRNSNESDAARHRCDVMH